MVEAGLSPVVQVRVEDCTNAQIVAWYTKHHDPTVRALAQRLAIAEAEKTEAYAQGIAEGLKTAEESAAKNVNDELRGYY
jgi:hypothetical protein